MHLSIRLDEDSARALEYLERSRRCSRSEVVRSVLLEAASHRFSADALRAEASRLANDIEYVTESEAIAVELDGDDVAW